MSDNTTKMLTFDQIVKVDDLKEEIVEVEEWGGSVKIKAMSKATQQAIRERCTIKSGKEDKLDPNQFEMQMLIASVIDPVIDPDQAEALRAKAMGPIDHILKAVLQLNGLDEDTIKKAKSTFREGTPKS